MEKHLHVFRAQPHNWSVVRAMVSAKIPPHVHEEYNTPIYPTYFTNVMDFYLNAMP